MKLFGTKDPKTQAGTIGEKVRAIENPVPVLNDLPPALDKTNTIPQKPKDTAPPTLTGFGVVPNDSNLVKDITKTQEEKRMSLKLDAKGEKPLLSSLTKEDNALIDSDSHFARAWSMVAGKSNSKQLGEKVTERICALILIKKGISKPMADYMKDKWKFNQSEIDACSGRIER
jgi:hypothetical protein